MAIGDDRDHSLSEFKAEMARLRLIFEASQSQTEDYYSEGFEPDHNDIETAPSSPKETETRATKNNIVNLESNQDFLLESYFPATEDYATVKKIFSAETLKEVFKFLSPEDRKMAAESVLYEARILSDSPAGEYIKAVSNRITIEIARVRSETERLREEETKLKEVICGNRVGEKNEEIKDETSIADFEFDLRLVDVPFDDPRKEEVLVLPRSPLERAIYDVHDIIARQEEEKERAREQQLADLDSNDH